MFFPFPIKVRDGRHFDSIPFANSLLVALNVLIFCLGWHPYVGRGSSPFGVMTYAFGHADIGHLAFNMLTLLVFGSALNRRIGNGWYLVSYLGSAIALGLFGWLFLPGAMMGASGAIFAMIAMSLLLLPMAIIEIFYFALFPLTILIALIKPPQQWVFWFIRWDTFELRAWWGLFLVPLLELSGLLSHGWNWTNLGHLFGLACGVVCVLLLPTQISMNRVRYA
jgi:membrane associated rhomboid family serine protease